MTTAMIASVTDETFATEVGAGTGLVAVEFSAEWCGPCRVMTPIVEAVARELAPKLRVLEMDADANPRTAARFGVRGLPSMLVFRDGALVDRIVGAIPHGALRARLDGLVES
ncbi:MAG TPA: thioredoxin domain-containing protein [Gemmatimonadaceae bacterium]